MGVAATLLTLALALSGLWLWWPLRIVWFKRRPSWKRLNFDLHNVAGLYSSLFLIIVCVTGATMSFHGVADRWVRTLTGAAPAPGAGAGHAPSREGGERITLDTALRQARRRRCRARAWS